MSDYANDKAIERLEQAHADLTEQVRHQEIRLTIAEDKLIDQNNSFRARIAALEQPPATPAEDYTPGQYKAARGCAPPGTAGTSPLDPVRSIMERVMRYGDARAAAVAAVAVGEFGSQADFEEYDRDAVSLWDEIESATRAILKGSAR